MTQASGLYFKMHQRSVDAVEFRRRALDFYKDEITDRLFYEKLATNRRGKAVIKPNIGPAAPISSIAFLLGIGSRRDMKAHLYPVRRA